MSGDRGRVQPQPPVINLVFAAAGRDLMVGVTIVLKTFWEPSTLGNPQISNRFGEEKYKERKSMVTESVRVH